MMSTSKLVNKQFNSPINLYSPQSIQETLDRRTEVLSNGAIGIDFHQLAKPTNLQNSAVLRMLEEEERIKAEKAGLKRVAWPPPPEGEDYFNCIEQDPIQAKDKIGISKIEYSYRVPSGQVRRLHLPTKNWTPVVALVPPSSLQTNTISAPLITWTNAATRKIHALYEYDETRFQSQQNSQSHILGSWSDKPQQTLSIRQRSLKFYVQEQYSQDYYQQHNTRTHFEPPPTVITLRPEPPISQTPSPVYQAQPAAINPNSSSSSSSSSSSMRGDLKWPPAPVKEQAEAENRARIELAKGPVCRPRRVNKDYSGFFAQHSSTKNYPVYRAPPGTQYFTPAYQQ
ncbi:PREDICTED: uncharacterized protein LOC105368493 [Ceratosolen solmsi marchali]|uniref:Uncharacterized protein LOC105368493 n=1 Tax=Ceratosolen solmsi marchali TaxID=326594 RepID=A0AAJ6YWU2_9HYME|nr:PREDICTED: uncharacterized protein LOC105368493 [Ceratosolen solmsi marchali]